MAVNKRTRFEVSRRDGFRCRYCGLPADETGAGLTIDHVVPVALGGDDAPTNLVTACRDCNAGKSSASLDSSPVPESVSAETQLIAVAQRSASIRAHIHAFDELLERFEDVWGGWHSGTDPANKIARPADWEASVTNLAQQGAPIDLFEFAIPIAMSRADRKYGAHAVFVYMLGIVRNKMLDFPLDHEVTASTAKTYTERDIDQVRVEAYETGSQHQFSRGWDAGFMRGAAEAARIESGCDVVRHHIDGTSTPLLDEWARVPDGA